MTEAERAYAAAVKEIARVKAAGETVLDLSGEAFRALDRIPDRIAELPGLVLLDFDKTQVADLTPLAPLTALKGLGLDNTQVAELSPIADLVTLEGLGLDNTEVTDLSPIVNLTALKVLELNYTRVTDLRPIRDLPLPGPEKFTGLYFTGTPFAEATEETRRLAAIEAPQERTRETLAFLKTLPPWPEPLPWESQAEDKPAPEPEPEPELEIPASIPAPLQVVELEGVLRPAMPGDGLDEAGSQLARQAWAALRDFLADLAELRPRLDNQMPQMARALLRFEAALGAEFAAVNPIAMGLHGQRVIRLVSGADETLARPDADELAELAAAITLFLERFPEWRAYRAAAGIGAPAPETVAAKLPEIEAITDELFDRAQIDTGVPESLKSQAATVRDDPTDPVATRGLVDSLGNVLSALALPLWRAVRTAGRATEGFARLTVDRARHIAATGLAAAGLDLLFNKAQLLTALATAMPERFGWILALLARLGL